MSVTQVIVFGVKVAWIHSVEFFNRSFQFVYHRFLSFELKDVVVALSRSLLCGRSYLTIGNPLSFGSGRNLGSIVVEFGRAIRITSVKRLCGRPIKVHRIG